MVVVVAGNEVGREGKRVEQQVSGWVGKMGWVGGFYHMHSVGLSTLGWELTTFEAPQAVFCQL